LGIECDYLPGLEDYWREFLADKPLSHVLGSVHPQMAAYRELFFRDDARAYQEQYFENLALAAETGLFDTLSHPDLVKNESPVDWDVIAVLPHIQRALDRIAATGVAMELNTSGVLKSLSQMNPGPEILREMQQRQIPVVIGADAHVPERAADGYEEAMDILSEAGYTQISFFLDRQRHDVPIERARASLKSTSS
jgi:histidinol-phosphatase (PHP family)